MRFPLTKPANVKLAFLAIWTPESRAAPRDATIGIPTSADLKMISPDNRPVEVKNRLPKARFFKAAIPITLSTAL